MNTTRTATQTIVIIELQGTGKPVRETYRNPSDIDSLRAAALNIAEHTGDKVTITITETY